MQMFPFPSFSPRNRCRGGPIRLHELAPPLSRRIAFSHWVFDKKQKTDTTVVISFHSGRTNAELSRALG